MKKISLTVLSLTLLTILLTGCTNTSTPENNSISDPQTQIDIQDERADTIQYLPYSEELYNNFLKSEKFALFFYTKDDKSSKTTEENILDNMDNLPRGTKIIKANYDKESTLKDTYKVTKASTVVVIDSKGNPTETLTSPQPEDLIKALEEAK